MIGYIVWCERKTTKPKKHGKGFVGSREGIFASMDEALANIKDNMKDYKKCHRIIIQASDISGFHGKRIAERIKRIERAQQRLRYGNL